MRCSVVGVILVVGVGLSGCAAANKLINGDPKPADQADVLTFQPLSIPPDYTLVPDTNAAPAQTASALDQASSGQGQSQATDQSGLGQSQTLLSTLPATSGSTSSQAGSTDPSVSAGEQSLLDSANADKANPDIRQLLATDSVGGSEGMSKNLTDELILWNPAQQQVTPPGKSSAAPTITRVEATPLSGLFN